MSDESNPDGPRYHVFLAQPNAGSVMPCCALGMLQATFRHKLHVNVSQFGALVHNFNMCWCEALNRREELGLTHFAMLHSDIKVSPSWIDALIEEMDRVDAEVMSAVVAIKDSRGLTTTGIRYADTIGCRRFTMREIVQLPETFSIEDCGDPETESLAINTGCWVCRLNTGWADRFPGFSNHYAIRHESGRAIADFDSEDWRFSDWLAREKIRTFATRKVQTAHVGGMDYPNEAAWGLWDTELQAPQKPPTEKLRKLPDRHIEIVTEAPIAATSLDHQQPLGTALDNSVNRVWNRALYDLIPTPDVRLLDLGCAGGGLVRSILEDGGFAVGIEGSDFNRERGRGEWTTIPGYLATADITEPFAVRNGQPLSFNIFTAWEVLEHIPDDRLPGLVENLKAHAASGAIFIGSISQNREPHHRTVQPKPWWIERLGALGLVHAPDIEQHFGDRLVRGYSRPDAQSFVFAARVAP